MFSATSTPHPEGRRSERGSTLTGYALTVAVMVVVALGSMSALENNSEDFLENTGDKIGEPRESAQAAGAMAQQSYGNGNSTGSGAAPPATTAPNVSTTTTTAAPTTTTTAAPTTTTTTTAPPSDVHASVNWTAPAGQNYTGGNWQDARDAGYGTSVTLTVPADGYYRFVLTDVGTGNSSGNNSVFVSFNGGASAREYHTEYDSSVISVAERYADAGLTNQVDIASTLTAGQVITVTIYPREDGIVVGGVALLVD